MDQVLAYWPVISFLAAASITPGPNNMMLAASGMNFGMRRTVPHMAGIVTGFLSLLLLCLVGVGALYESLPFLRMGFKIFGGAYLLYLAYRIATSHEVKISNAAARPLNFWEAAGFQYANPKAVVAALALVGILPPLGFWMNWGVLVALELTIGVLALIAWASFGKVLAKIFTTPKTRRIVNFGLALLLVATIPVIMM